LEQLATLLAEIEAVLNSRPLTYVYEDFQSGFTLTPSHFLVTNRKLGLPSTEDGYGADEEYQPKRNTATQLLTAWKKGQKYLDLLWKVWRGEYLLSLQENLPIHHKNSKRLTSMVPNVNGRDQSVTECDDKKRKAHLIARQQIQRCLMDNGTSVLFAFPGGCQD